MSNQEQLPDSSEDERSSLRRDALRRSGLLRHGRSNQLDRLTDLAAMLVGAPVALISVIDGDRQFFTSEHGLSDPLGDGPQTPLSLSVCKTVVANETALVLDDFGADATFRHHPAREVLNVESYCGVPITDPQGVVLGSFCVIDNQAHQWDVGTVKILQQLALVVTDSIATSQEFTAMVHDLQGRLLPPVLPKPATGALSALYRPVPYSDAVGGDFYDAMAHEDGTVDVVVCDVVGHGITSTQAAAQLRAATRTVLRERLGSPADVINRVAASCEDLPGCENAAMIVAQFTPDGRAVRWARAGAMPPILTGPDRRLLEEGAGPPLGVGPCFDDPSCQRVLQPGESLLLFTDGLVERRGEAIDAGLNRLLGLCLATPDLGTLIELSCPGPLQTDDIAVVCWTA